MEYEESWENIKDRYKDGYIKIDLHNQSPEDS